MARLTQLIEYGTKTAGLGVLPNSLNAVTVLSDALDKSVDKMQYTITLMQWLTIQVDNNRDETREHLHYI